ncbi:unnamed protein product, partial [Anisakis simplex]|uniref:JmjC domain-containing protein n=1 Tax=Anisakis simplex TaxID=6269 RepID=A0A0M3JUA2_ANISI
MRSVKQVKRTHRVRSMKNAAACKRQAYRRRMQAKQNWLRTAEEVAERQRVREQRRHEKELAKQKASTSALPKPKKIKKEKKPVVASVILEPKKYEKQQKQQQQQQQQPPKEKLKTEDEKGKQQQQQQPSKESQKDSKPVTQKEKPKDDKKKKESTKLVDGGERVESKGKKQKGPSPPIISADSGTIAKETDKEKGKKRGKEELREEERQSKKDVPKEDEIKKIHNRPSENANDAIQQSHGAFAATGAETFQKIKHDDLLNEMDVVKEDVNKSLVAPAKHDDDELKHDRDSEVKADKKHHRKHKHDDLLNETDVVKEDVDKPLVTPAKHDDDELEHDRDSEMKADKKHHRKHKVSGGRHSESEKHHAPETHKQLQQPSDETVIEPVPGTDAVTHEVQPDVGNELPKKHKKKRNRKSESEHHLPSPDEVQYVEGDSVELNDAEQIEGGEFTEVISRHHKKKSRSSESDAMHDEKSNTTATEGEEQQQEEEIPNSVKPILPSSDFSGAVEERLVGVVEPAAEQQPSYDVDEQETFVKATEQIKRDDKSEEMTINELESELREQHPNEAIAAEFQHPPVQSAVEPSSDQQSSEFIPRTDDRHLIEETSKIGENSPEVFDSMLSENIKLVRTSHEEQPVAADEGHVKQDEEALPVEEEKIKEQVIDELRKNEPDESTTFTKQTEGEKNKQILPESLGGTLDFDSSNAESSDLIGVGSLSEEAPKPDETETNIFKEPPQAATDEQPPFQVEQHRMKREEKASLKGQKEDREDERGQSTTLMEENSEEVPSVQEKTSARTEGHPELLSSNVEPSDSAWMDFLSDETPMPTEPQSEAEALEDQSQTINERLPLETDESLVKHEEDALSKEPGKVENEPKSDELAAVEEETSDKKFPSEQEALERIEEMPAQGELQTSKIDS